MARFCQQGRRLLRTHGAGMHTTGVEMATCGRMHRAGDVAAEQHALARQAGLDRLQTKQHTPSMRIDPDATGGVVELKGKNDSMEAGA